MIRSKVACIVFAAITMIGLAPIGFAQSQGYLFNQYGGPGSYNSWDNFALAQGDFNQDGRLDFAVAQVSSGYPSVGIYLAQPDGSYQLSQTILLGTPSGDSSNVISVADLNGDHLLDIVCMDSRGNVWVLLGQGNGFFQPPVMTPEGSIVASTMAVGDFNGDGSPDLAVSDNTQIYVMLGNGDGTFGSPAAYGAPSQVTFVITADFNGDGKLDLASANFGKSVSLFLGIGDGTFQSPSTFPVNGDAESLAAADMNGDKKLDLVVGTANNTGLSVLLGNGDGTFQPPIYTAFASNDLPRAIVTGDFNGDGKIDVVTAGDQLGPQVFLGTGTGTFKANPHIYGPQLAWTGPNLIVAGDYNLDGKLDFAILPIVSPLPFEIFTNNGDGTFLSGRTLNAGKGTYATASADFNGDGKADLIAVNSGSNNVSVFLGNGNGTFQAAKAYATGSEPKSVAVGDFNGDGHPDLAVANYNEGTASILLNNGDGTFKKQVKYSVGQSPQAIVAIDLNSDGKLDLVVGNRSALAVLLGNGDGTFQAAISYGIGSDYSALAIADFNGDGKLDAAVVDNNGNSPLGIMFGDGAGGFGTAVPVSIFPIDQVESVAAGNLRGFGIQDIVVGGSCCAGLVGVLLNNGDGTFQKVLIAATTAIGQASSIALADVNGDGALDAVAAGNPGVAVLLGDGAGSLLPDLVWYGSSGQGGGVGVTPNGIAMADFNGDGSLDLAVVENKGSSVAGALSIFLSNPVAVFSSSSLNFGSVKVGSNSSLILTLTNQSGTTLAISSIATSGSGASAYSQTNTCGSTLAGYANCTVTVTIKPSAKKKYTASLKFTDSAAGPARTIPLSGTGD
jgi:hypothetical protein